MIRRVFSDPTRSRKEVLQLRRAHTDREGMYHIPSFSGGGGLGLLECIRLARENALELDWNPPSDEREGLSFILGKGLYQHKVILSN